MGLGAVGDVTEELGRCIAEGARIGSLRVAKSSIDGSTGAVGSIAFLFEDIGV